MLIFLFIKYSKYYRLSLKPQRDCQAYFVRILRSHVWWQHIQGRLSVKLYIPYYFSKPKLSFLFFCGILLYRRSPGQHYLKNTITGPLQKLCGDKDLILEINPLKVYEAMINDFETSTGRTSPLDRKATPEQAAENPDVQVLIKMRLESLGEITDAFIESLILSLDSVPYGIRWICKQIRALVRVCIKLPNIYGSELIRYSFLHIAILSRSYSGPTVLHDWRFLSAAFCKSSNHYSPSVYACWHKALPNDAS